MKSRVLILAILGILGSLGAIGQEEKRLPQEDIVLSKLSEDIKVQSHCGDYFGYNSIAGLELKCVFFNYESEANLYIKQVVDSSIITIIDNAREKPTASFLSTDKIIIKISEKDFEQAKICLPQPKQEKK